VGCFVGMTVLAGILLLAAYRPRDGGELGSKALTIAHGRAIWRKRTGTAGGRRGERTFDC